MTLLSVDHKRNVIYTVDEFSLNIPMVPVPKGRPRSTRSGHTYTPQKTRDAENTIREACRSAWRLPPFSGPLVVELEFYFAKPKTNKTNHHTQRPDADNLGKLVTDAMNGVIYNDDSQITKIISSKLWAEDGEPMVCIRVTPKE